MCNYKKLRVNYFNANMSIFHLNQGWLSARLDRQKNGGQCDDTGQGCEVKFGIARSRFCTPLSAYVILGFSPHTIIWSKRQTTNDIDIILLFTHKLFSNKIILLFTHNFKGRDYFNFDFLYFIPLRPELLTSHRKHWVKVKLLLAIFSSDV